MRLHILQAVRPLALSIPRGWIIFGLAIACWALVLTPFAFAQALVETASSTVDFLAPLQALVPIAAEIVLTVLGLAGLWLVKLLRDKWKIDLEAAYRAVEARHREALHSAVATGLGSAVSKYGSGLQLDVGSPAAAHVIQSVIDSVPDAVKTLKPTDNWILKAAAAKQAETTILFSEPASSNG
ncbi:MAG TPA: hypothetical protein VGN79_12465 [Devosia sp.]|jgi:hypothetical protein|nr:hypothetical protein [Devosia sp.]